MIPDCSVLRTPAVLQQYARSAHFPSENGGACVLLANRERKPPPTSKLAVGAIISLFLYHYIIPMPGAPIPAGAAGAASLISATRLSVVRSVDATLVAF